MKHFSLKYVTIFVRTTASGKIVVSFLDREKVAFVKDLSDSMIYDNYASFAEMPVIRHTNGWYRDMALPQGDISTKAVEFMFKDWVPSLVNNFGKDFSEALSIVYLHASRVLRFVEKHANDPHVDTAGFSDNQAIFYQYLNKGKGV